MNRALAVLTAGAFLTLALRFAYLGATGLGMLLVAIYALLGTVGFAWVRRRGRLGWAVVYVAIQLALTLELVLNDPGLTVMLMLVVLVSQCVLVLPRKGTALVIALVALAHYPPLAFGVSLGERPIRLYEVLATLGAVLFTAVVMELLRREQQARGELAEAHARLRDYAAQAERLATAQERNRVARDIHDGLGHSLTVVQMQVKAARAVLPTDSAKADAVLAKAQQQAEAALGEVRRSVSALREPRQTPPLPEALHALAAEMSASGMPARLTVRGAERPLPDDTREALYRAAQEGLTNVRKHAHASSADLVLDYAGAAVRLEVRDDGPGATDGRPPGFGLLGLRERAAQFGGQLRAEPVPGQGWTLMMEIPDEPGAGAARGRPGAVPRGAGDAAEHP